MKNCILIIGIVFTFFIACKKESNEPSNVPGNYNPIGITNASLADYIKIDSAGNYWTYDIFQVDSNGTSTFFNAHDSVYVINDSVLNGNIYKHIMQYTFAILNSLIRDSSGFLVNERGDLFLKVNNLPDTISVKNTTQFDVYTYCSAYPGSFTVPAGTFNNVIKTSIDYYVKPPLDTSANPIHSALFFAKGVGIIQENFSYLSQALVGIHNERRLVSYYVQ